MGQFSKFLLKKFCISVNSANWINFVGFLTVPLLTMVYYKCVVFLDRNTNFINSIIFTRLSQISWKWKGRSKKRTFYPMKQSQRNWNWLIFSFFLNIIICFYRQYKHLCGFETIFFFKLCVKFFLSKYSKPQNEKQSWFASRTWN